MSLIRQHYLVSIGEQFRGYSSDLLKHGPQMTGRGQECDVRSPIYCTIFGNCTSSIFTLEHSSKSTNCCETSPDRCTQVTTSSPEVDYGADPLKKGPLYIKDGHGIIGPGYGSPISLVSVLDLLTDNKEFTGEMESTMLTDASGREIDLENTNIMVYSGIHSRSTTCQCC